MDITTGHSPQNAPPTDQGDIAPRTVEHSQDDLSDIVGLEAHAGERLQAGPILKLMYDTAVVVAFRHCGYRPVLLRLDRIDLTRSICHMDLVCLEGRMVEVGRSSMVIEVRCFAKSPTVRDFTPRHVGYLTMVAIDDQGEPVRTLPLLSYDTPQGRESKALAAHRRAQLEERKNALAWTHEDGLLGVNDVIEPGGPERYERLESDETVVRVKSQLISHSPYLDSRVRAGDLLLTLDRIANYTARRFTGNQHTITLSVNDVVFKQPLHATDRIELISRVSYVRTHTLEVTVDIIVHTMEGQQVHLDPVNIFIINFGPSGEKKRITTGLTLSEESQDDLRRYLKARTRYAFWKAHPESHLTQSLE